MSIKSINSRLCLLIDITCYSYGVSQMIRIWGMAVKTITDDNRLISSGLIRAVYIILFALISTSGASAAERGASTFIPGTYGDFGVAIKPPPGIYVRNTVFHYSADRHQKTGVDAKVDVDFWVNYSTASIVTDWTILGAKYNFAFGIPLVDAEVDQYITGAPALDYFDNRTATGDFFIVPVSLFWTFGDLSLNLYEYIVTPTGAFSKNKIANAGFGHWAFQTHLAMTWLNPERGQEISLNVGHVFNAENSDTNYKTGQEVFAEYLVAQYLSPEFGIGLQGYFHKQITGDSGRGASFGDFKGAAAGIGPAVLWNTKFGDQKAAFIGKWLHEYHADKRFKGNFIYGTLVLSFD